MRVVILGDLHFPFHHKDAYEWAMKYIEEKKPTHVVQIGDLFDQYCFSRFTKRMFLEPKKELEEARKLAEEMWKRIRKNSEIPPQCFQIIGNHDVRAIKRIEEKAPEFQEIFQKSMREYYEFEGVTTSKDDREILKIGNVIYHHGWLSKLGDHMRYFGESVVVGHSHVGGVVLQQKFGRTISELNAGHLADETSEPLRYRPTTTSKWTLGIGEINDGKEAFIRYEN